MNSCSPDENLLEAEPTLDQILGGKEVVVHKGLLTFKDPEVFNRMADELSKKDIGYIRAWEKGLGFRSAYSIYEDAIEEEDRFLETMVKKHGENSELTRREIGFSEFTQKYLDKGLLSSDEDGVLNVNVMIPMLAPLVNEESLVRVGNEIRQYKYNYLRKILDVDYNKIGRLNELNESSDGIHVAAVERQQHEIKDVGRTKALSSCESINGSHRLIGYEEKILVNDGGTPCPFYRNDYYIRLRSLKKILGTWQNFKTTQFTITSTVAFDHLNCDYTVRNGVDSFNSTYYSTPSGWEWHTLDLYWVRNFNTGPCQSSTGNCYGPGSMVFRVGYSRYHYVTGVNGTACDLP